MVSFSCESCGDVLTKKKLDPHRSRCRGATFTCIDCMVYFPGFEYRSHTSCISEDQKYQGALYKPKKQKPTQGQQKENQDPMAHRAYVKDATDDFNLPPEAPMPPPAVPDDANVNVFDFLEESTSAASNVHLPLPQTSDSNGSRQHARFNQDAGDDVDESGYMVDDDAAGQHDTVYETPVPKSRKKTSKGADREAKKDKKRKRLHAETSPGVLESRADEVMTDAPPVLHSGLTDGLNRMMHPSQFPPSPDYSGGDGGEASPTVPSRKKKESKSPKSSRESLSNGLMAFMSGTTSKSKVSKKRKDSSERKEKKRRTSSGQDSTEKKSPKMIEYRAKAGEEKNNESNALVIYRPRSDLFLSLCNKGPESDRGCSVRKALKRFHRERTSTGKSLSKGLEEKELWRSLRMRRNERGEIVLFTLEDEDAA